jgi:hypothetical protein
VKAFVIIDGELYKHGVASILMRCIPRDQGRELPQEIHAGTCGTMPGREHLSERPSSNVFIGPQRSPTRRTLCGAVRVANSMQDNLTSRRKHCRRSPSRGPSQSGTSTRWGRSDKHPGGHSPLRGGRQVLKVDQGSTHSQHPF